MNWEFVVLLASLGVGAVTAIGAVPLIDWIKGSLKLSTRWAQVLTLVVATFLAVANLIITEQIIPGTLTPEAMLAMAATILTATQAEYLRLKRAGE